MYVTEDSPCRPSRLLTWFILCPCFHYAKYASLLPLSWERSADLSITQGQRQLDVTTFEKTSGL